VDLVLLGFDGFDAASLGVSLFFGTELIGHPLNLVLEAPELETVLSLAVRDEDGGDQQQQPEGSDREGNEERNPLRCDH